jgi:hypothetical protein
LRHDVEVGRDAGHVFAVEALEFAVVDPVPAVYPGLNVVFVARPVPAELLPLLGLLSEVFRQSLLASFVLARLEGGVNH